MHSMSGAGGGGGGADHHGDGQLYGDNQRAAGSVTLYHGGDAVDSVFFQSQACSSAGGDAAAGFTPSYSSITDYLQGFLDPAGLARDCLDAPPDPATGQELSAGDMIGHDGRHGRQAGGTTPNSSTSGEQDDEERRRCNRVRAEDEGEIEGEKPADQQNNHGGDKKRKKEKVETKARGSRVAFATKSEVDHLDDGYRWRKYGQKAVKNSSFPRSYYRCTAPRCGVKKQVERSQQDPSTVVTTYEGQHAHPSPAAHRGMATGFYSLASLQQRRHGFSPSSPDDFHLAAARATAPPAAAASPAVLLPHQAEYYGMQPVQDVLLDPLAGNQLGHR